MKRGLNQNNVPDWFENAHWHIEIVCELEPLVDGELTLYPNGDAKIGTRIYARDVPIDHWQFAGGFIAKRHIDRTEWLVIRTPAGKYHYYKYRRLLGVWERYTPFTDPTLDRCVGSYGPRLGSLVFEMHRFAAELCRHFVTVFLNLLSLCLGYLFWCLVVALVVGAFSLVGGLAK